MTNTWRAKARVFLPPPLYLLKSLNKYLTRKKWKKQVGERLNRRRDKEYVKKQRTKKLLENADEGSLRCDMGCT